MASVVLLIWCNLGDLFFGQLVEETLLSGHDSIVRSKK